MLFCLSGLKKMTKVVLLYMFAGIVTVGGKYELYSFLSKTKVCFLLEWCFIISVGVSSDHSQLRCTGIAGSH